MSLASHWRSFSLRRRWPVITTFVVACAALGLYAYNATDGPALLRALPPGQFVLYANLVPLRGTGFTLPASARAQEYAAFVRDSGVDFERDVDELALSVSDSAAAPRHTSTLVLRGRFGRQLRAYLGSHGRALGAIAGGDAYQFDRADDPAIYVLLLGDNFAAVTSQPGTHYLTGIAQRYTWRALTWQRTSVVEELPRAERNGALVFAALDYAGLAAEGDRLFGDSFRGTRVIAASVSPRGSDLHFEVFDRTTTPAGADSAAASAEDLLSSLRRSARQSRDTSPEALALLSRVRVSVSGDQVRIHADAPASEVLRLIAAQTR